jgi:PEP-CTERM motif-containing protein
MWRDKMRYCLLICLVAAGLLVASAPISATPAPVPLFNECPHVGQALGCSYLIELGAGGSIGVLFDQNVKGVHNHGDILVGLLNNSGSYFNLNGYSGPNSIFSGIHLTGGLGDGKSTYFEVTDPFGDGNDYYDKEDCDDKDGDSKSCEDGGGKGVTPEPGSIMLLGTGLVVLGGTLRRKLLP